MGCGEWIHEKTAQDHKKQLSKCADMLGILDYRCLTPCCPLTTRSSSALTTHYAKARRIGLPDRSWTVICRPCGIPIRDRENEYLASPAHAACMVSDGSYPHQDREVQDADQRSCSGQSDKGRPSTSTSGPVSNAIISGTMEILTTPSSAAVRTSHLPAPSREDSTENTRTHLESELRQWRGRKREEETVGCQLTG